MKIGYTHSCMKWRVELFGGPRLIAPSGKIFDQFATQKAAGLLAYLALTLPRWHLREVVAEQFWPDKDPALSRNSLSAALSSLRPILGGALATGRLRVGLDPACVTTDLAELETALATGDVNRARQLSALEFLPGFYDDWVVLERERLAARMETAPPTRPEPRNLLELHNLPEPLVSFIGRERERHELRTLLDTARLVTLTGSGGSGKTRLSQHVARDVLERFADGVWLIELASLTDPAQVVRTVATTLRINEVPDQTILGTLIQSLKAKKILLLLDNCEHVLEASACLAESLLQICPKLQILATSREALGVVGERPYRVPVLAQGDAIQLFVERAALQLPNFVRTEQNAPTLAAICTRLDGIPLAIELAAARLRSLSLEELYHKLSQSFALLTGGSRTALPRHQTLQGLIDWSYNLLTESEKTLLCRLSVFAGGWTLEAAEPVCSGEDIAQSAVFDLLTSLVDKSLVVIIPTEPQEKTRYRLLETVRQYARERLHATLLEAVQASHLEYFRTFCQLSLPKQFQSDAVAELDRLEQEHDNIRGALTFGTNSPDENRQLKALEIAGLLHRFWYMRSYFKESAQWYKIILALPVATLPSEAQGLCLIGAGMMARMQTSHVEAKALFERCLSEQKAIGHNLNVATVLTHLASLTAEILGDQEKALEYERDSLVFAQRSNNINAIALSLINMGVSLMNLGKSIDAQEKFEKGLSLARIQGNKRLIASALGSLGMLAHERGEHTKACDLGRENLMICQAFGSNFPLSVAFNYMAIFTQGAGDFKLSRYYRVESLLLAHKFGLPLMCLVVVRDIAELDGLEGNFKRSATLLSAVIVLRKVHEAVLTVREEYHVSLRMALGDVAFDQAFAEGTRLTLSEAVAIAISPA